MEITQGEDEKSATSDTDHLQLRERWNYASHLGNDCWSNTLFQNNERSLLEDYV